SSVYLNSMKTNTYGVRIDESTFNRFEKNNLVNNSIYNIYNLGIPAVFTNNWWGSTSVTNIASTISNHGGYSNFIPFRLFGEFNNEENTDTDTLPRITQVTAYVTNESSVILKWNQTSGGDFVKYNIYHTTNETKWSNFTYNDVITQTSPVIITNILDEGLDGGTHYYYITAMDDPFSLYTNECWYSPGAEVTVVLTTLISISKSVSNISVNNNPTGLIPGSTLTYKITYSNTGAVGGKNIVIYDRMASFVSFSTSLMGTATGWTMQYTTNNLPSQAFDSTDYSNGYTVKTNVKWLRWKKPLIQSDEDGQTLIYKVIIK
ncbi:MAG: hypothetical protein KKH98_01690, partial [Spirochaetes bacterium]|nr:hypothetical protein [Spirochaetota bacterium]